MHPVEFTWYKALVLLASALAIGVGVLNIVYFNNIRLRNNCNEISSTEANTALWLNVILVIFSAIVFFWSFYRLVFSGEPDKQVINTTVNNHYHPASPDPLTTNTPPANLPASPN